MAEIPEYVRLEARKELARRFFWDFEKLLYPELFTEERKLLKDVAETLQDFIENNDRHYLVLSLPPGHYKSFTAKNLSMWLMGKNPRNRVIGASNSGDLSGTFSTQIRDTILGINVGKQGIPYPEIFPDTKIKQGFATKSKWELEGSSEPSYRATSPTSTLTGARADCLSGDTLVNTSNGMRRIDEIHNGKHQGDILTYNHKKHTIEYERLVATREIKQRKVYEVNLSNGTSFRATKDHKIYVVGTGYRTLGWINREADGGSIQLRVLQQPIPTQEIRSKQSDTERQEDTVLLSRLYDKANEHRAANELLQVWEARQKRLGLLFKSMLKKVRLGSEATKYRLSILLKKLQTTISHDKVLFYGMQEQTSLGGNKDEEVCFKVSKGVQGHSEVNHRAGQGLFKVPFFSSTKCSSFRWVQTQQQPEEPSNDVQELSYRDAYVVSVQKCSDRESVYDIQTESNHNFFANGTLVHNCFIIDDIIKNHVDAMNARVHEANFDWFRNTLFSRADGDNYKFIFVMQRWAKADLSGRVIDFYGDDVVSIDFPAMNDKDEMLEPTIMSKEKLIEAKRTLRPEVFKANYLQKPMDVEGRLYKGFSEWDSLPDVPIKKNNTDIADQGKDNVCSINWCEKDGKVYITDVYYSPEKAEITEPKVAKMINSGEVTEAEFESNNGGKGYARNIERELKDLGNIKTVVKWTPQNSNKEARILTSSAWVQNNVYMPPNWTSKYPEFAQEVLGYVAGSKNEHDDGVDTLATIYERTANNQVVDYSWSVR